MKPYTQQRQSQRVVLRTPLAATIGEQRAVVLELGSQGAKLEHPERLAIGTRHPLRIAGVDIEATVRHATIQPGFTVGMLFHSGVEFDEEDSEAKGAIYELLVAEAEAQVREWESNFAGVAVPRTPPRIRSAVATRFVWLRLTKRGWERSETSDPNQPLDGFAVPLEEAEESVRLLCETYEKGDAAQREYLRRCAALSILESRRR